MAIYGGPDNGNGSSSGGSRRSSAKRSTTPKDGKPAGSVRRIAGTVMTVVVLIAVPMLHANMLMHRTMQMTFPDYEVDYRASWPRPLGGVSASGVRVLPFGDDEPDEVFMFDTVTLKIPFFQYFRSMFKFFGMINGIDRIEMVFEGGRGSMTMPLVPEMSLFGNVSLSPFEAEGCVVDGNWIDSEFDEMGLPNEPLAMTLIMAREDGKSILDARLAKPGIGELSYRSIAVLHDMAPLMAAWATADDEMVSEEWHLRDDSFAAARNRHCARKDGVTEAEFIERHLFTVTRKLEALGMAADPELQSAYRDFAKHGGTFDINVTYADASHFVATESTHGGDLLNILRTSFTVNGRALGESMSSVRPRALPNGDETLATFTLLRREWEARNAESDTSLPEQSAVIAADLPPVPGVSRSAEAGAAAQAVAYAAPAPARAEADPDIITDYRALGRQTGQRFLVHFRNKSSIRIEVVGMDGSSVRVRRWMQSGWAEHLLDRVGFDRAERLH